MLCYQRVVHEEDGRWLQSMIVFKESAMFSEPRGVVILRLVEECMYQKTNYRTHISHMSESMDFKVHPCEL